jgi:hypothetical protein
LIEAQWPQLAARPVQNSLPKLITARNAAVIALDAMRQFYYHTLNYKNTLFAKNTNGSEIFHIVLKAKIFIVIFVW